MSSFQLPTSTPTTTSTFQVPNVSLAPNTLKFPLPQILPKPSITTINTNSISLISNNNQKQFGNLTPWDLNRLFQHYMHVGFVFSKDNLQSPWTADSISEHLQTSLAQTLSYFYPLAGRLITETSNVDSSMSVSINCNGEGVEFTHAVANDVDVGKLLSPFADSQSLIHGLFPLRGALNYDGLYRPLFAAQLTDFADGFFLGCSFNHSVGDGNSFIQFLKSWAEIAKSSASGVDLAGVKLSRPPSLDHWFDASDRIKMPADFMEGEVIVQRTPNKLCTRLFNFSTRSLDILTERANKECDSKTLSSYLAMCALAWSITRARNLAENQKSTFWVGVDNRLRLKPRLHRNYFGNAADSIGCQVDAKELLTANGLGYGAQHLHGCLTNHNDSAIKNMFRDWIAKPILHPTSQTLSDPNCVTTTGSPRFNTYGCDFGWGSPAGLRSGESTWFDDVVAGERRERQCSAGTISTVRGYACS